jgi:hypothetical protein
LADLLAGNATDRAQELCRDFASLRGRRGNWESHWDEIAERVQPMDSYAFLSRGENTKGDKRNVEIFDSTPMIALGRFGAILDSMLTPRNQTWHRLKPSDDNLLRSRAVRLYFEEVNRLLFKFRYAPKANFASQNQKNYKSLGAYGTGCMFVDELAMEPGLRYRAIHLSEIYFAENHQGIVDKAYRIFKLTARQAFQRWGEKVSDKVKGALKADKEREFEFLHAVVPREKILAGLIDFRSMPWESVYIEYETKNELEEGGFQVFPYAVSRYEQGLNEVYGRSPAMDSLPAIKTLNEEKKTMLKQGHRAADPVLLTHDDGILDSFSALPGSITAGGVSKDGRPLVHVLPTGSYQIGKDMMDDERSMINDSFLVTLFQILVETPQMSATEVLERAREKGILLAPTVGRQQSEYLGPLIEREIDLLARQQLLPPFPAELVEAQGEFSIEYDSPLSRLQRSEEAAGLARSFEEAMAIANATGDPSIFDHYNFDVALPEIADIRGVPERWIASAEELAAKRQSRAEAAERREAIEAAPSVAALTKAAGPVQSA